MMMKYNKLVRDKIPEKIKADGKVPKLHIADEEEFWEKLQEKLEEEVGEFLINNSEEEFADILEVIDAIYKFKNFDRKEMEKIKAKKSKDRGSFDKRIILDEIWE